MNSNLHKARRVKNDEFYTQLSDIEDEIKHYKSHFEGKTVFCNCDDPNMGNGSNFFEFFAQQFDNLGLKKLITVSFNDTEPTYKWVVDRQLDVNNDGRIDKRDAIRSRLTQDGDFRSDESIEILKEADIVVTNPPFSLFREYIAQLMEYDKKFIVIGPDGAWKYRRITDMFTLVKNNDIWLGFTNPKSFVQPDGTVKKFGNIGWFTNLDHKRRHEDLTLYKTYNEEEFPTYDNYHAIEVGKVNDIPLDYKGVMGVPGSYLYKHNPEKFEIIGFTNSGEKNPGLRHSLDGNAYLNGRSKYTRILIKRK